MTPNAPYRGRYAPSPTGALHLGNARTALVAWWRARSRGGSLVMRVEDLDRARTDAGSVAGNLDELRWLGLDWDEGPDVGGPHAPYRQSERDDDYHEALARLERSGRVFACYLSRRELREIASAPHGRAAVYGEAERRLNSRIAEAKRRDGKAPSLRYRVDAGEIRFVDRLAGERRVEASCEVGDIVLRRADGVWAYQFAVVVDDVAMEIGEVVRGDDLLASTAAQLVLYRALGARPPAFFHLPLLLDTGGERLAKRRGSLTLRALRDAGVAAPRVVGLLAHSLGLLSAPRELTAAEGLELFTPERLEARPARLTAEGLAWLTSA